MKPFTFRLAGLLSLREGERDARRVTLTEVLAKQARAIADREAVERKFIEQQSEHRRLQAAGTLMLDVLLRATRHAASLRQELAERGAAEQLAAAEVLRCQDVLAIAHHEVEVLEKLREHQQARHQLDCSRTEVKQFDEVAAQRLSRSPAPSSRAA